MRLLKQAAADWMEDDAPRLAASLSFYTALSVAPLLIIAIAVAGLAFGEEAARGEILGQLQGLVGHDSAKTVESMVESAAKPKSGIISTIISVVVLLFGATGVFAELQTSLNHIWELKPKPGRGIWQVVRQRFLSLGMVLGIGFLLLVALILSAALSAVGKWAEASLPGSVILWQVGMHVVAFALVATLFAMIFKVLPDAEVSWRDVWVGAVVTALLFTVGKFLIGLYLGRASVTSSYGAAGSIIVFLLWAYYSAQIVFMGAEITQVYARMYGTRIQPGPNAVPVDDEKRAPAKAGR
ncbi:MAG TPA: YihY/virulence factor BrkB family protein [Polyangiaceae bacterium]